MRRRFLASALAALILAPQPTGLSAQPADLDSRYDGCRGEREARAAKAGDPEAARPAYPYDVARITRAYRRLENEDPTASNVAVVVVDNGFVGYGWDGSRRRATPNFPQPFFYGGGNEFHPFNIPLPLPTPGADEVRWGHGTHVTGLVLGGMYGDGAPSNDGLDLGSPGVRRLFFSDGEGRKASAVDRDPEDWLTLYVVTLATTPGSLEYQTAQLEKLPTTIKVDLPKRLRHPQIINLSVQNKYIAGGGSAALHAIPKDLQDSLLVVSSGNDGEPLESGSDARFPAGSTAMYGNLVVVGSHDIDFSPSKFSNFDAEVVTLAAPGCALKSWVSGAGEAKALNGTSQAAAVVSFAAALIRSRWLDAGPSELRERLMVASRYSRDLYDGCKSDENGVPKRVGCVRNGSALDIEMALYLDTDALEYCVDEAGRAADNCATRIVVGTLERAPTTLRDCQYRPHAKSIDPSHELTRPAAVRLMPEPGADAKPKHQLLYRVAAPGQAAETLGVRICEGVEGEVRFLPEVDQPDGAAAPTVLTLPMGRVTRLITRSR